MNRHSDKRKIELMHLLLEGVGIRSAQRLTKLAKGTVQLFRRQMAAMCRDLHDERVRGVRPVILECDEAWTFVRGRELNRQRDWEQSAGNTWVYTAIERDTRLLVSWLAAKRHYDHADTFVRDVADRCVGDFTIVTDGYFSYPIAIETVFWDRPGVVHEVSLSNSHRPGAMHTNTVEAHNGAMRRSISAMRRESMNWAKSIAGLDNALSIYIVHYNFCRRHTQTGKVPAVAAGLIDVPLTVADLVAMARQWSTKKAEEPIQLINVA